jgi:hypothetical protein
VASIATLDDLDTWLGTGVVDNPARAEAILAAASTLVRAKTGAAWVDADGEPLEDVDTDELEAVRTVVVQVAARVWLNPHGDTQRTTGPFSHSVAEWASLGLSLTEAEADMLPNTRANARPALWTQATTRVDPVSDVPDIYLDVTGTDEQIPHVPTGSVNW